MNFMHVTPRYWLVWLDCEVVQMSYSLDCHLEYHVHFPMPVLDVHLMPRESCA